MKIAVTLLCLAVQAAPQPARPPVTGIAHVRVLAADLGKARKFYGGVLGLSELRWDAAAGVGILAVNPRQRIIVRQGPASKDDRLVDLAFETDSVAAARDSLIARGIQIAAPAADAEAGGRAVSMVDPDGHAVLLVEANPPRGAPARTASDNALSRRILHAGLTVKDAAAADRFYKDTLGFAEIWRGGRTDDVTSWINMRVPDGTDYLEYMLPAPSERPRVEGQSSPSTRRQLGIDHHIALLVPDIQEALERVRARTAPDDPNHRANPHIGRNNRWQLNLYDPDGTRVELMEPWTVR
jgi:catechol 2,3-dioxygenase-like lactoylglutathione lyase family enzyme